MQEQNSAVQEITRNIDAIAQRLDNVDKKSSLLEEDSHRLNEASRTLLALIEQTDDLSKKVSKSFQDFTIKIRDVQ
jgi:methyl-accepting chemotaxis protein